LAGLWPHADATPSQAGRLDALIRSPIVENSQRASIDQLLTMDSDESRANLNGLACSTADGVVLIAAGTLCCAGLNEAARQIGNARGAEDERA
jgi:hypothetical protein